MSESRESLNPAASSSRMYAALGVLVVLGGLAWFTIDPSAVIPLHGFSNRYVGVKDRDIEIRWFPLLILGMFGFRIVLANMRARLEAKKLEQEG